MHPEAYTGFRWAADAAGLDLAAPLFVLDVGGQHINGSVHDQFTHPETVITTLDVENADIIADARTWDPLTYGGGLLFDVVIATEVFEHVADWHAVVRTMHRALDPDGPGVLLTTCASTHRPPHGATGAPLPAPDEHYRNVDPDDLLTALRGSFRSAQVKYQRVPGDAYAWARRDETRPQVTVVIPTIPGRKDMLATAVESAWRQTLTPTDVIVEKAGKSEGPSVVRNRALARVETEFVAFLDDDDWLHPDHLDKLTAAQMTTGADLVWPWFQVDGGRDPFPMHRGRQWDPQDPHQIPITVLARTEAVRHVGGFDVVGEDAPTDRHGNRAGEDWRMWLALSAAGYRFHHIPDVTWTWVHHAGNSSGLPSRARNR